MKIGIDARLVAKGRGLGEFAHQLIAHLPDDDQHQYVIYTYKQADWSAVKLPSSAVIRLVPASYVISEQIVLPYLLRRDKIDIFHATTNTAPLLLPAKIKLILTIHDVMFLSDKQRIPTAVSWYQRLGRKYYALISSLIIKRANLVTTISNFSQQDIAEGFSIPADRIKVIYEGVGQEFKPATTPDQTLQKYSIDRPYFIHLGAIDPRKQTAFTIEAFKQFINTDAGRQHQLVVTGLNAKDSQSFQKLIQQHQLESSVKLVGFVAKSELIELLSAAQALLFPSLYEGFGLPMLQAMACHCPVITTNTTALPEIGGSAALYIDTGHHQQLVQQMTLLAGNLESRQQLVKAGLRQIKKFDWQQTADQYAKLYREVST